jgi:biotin operon repressor
MDDLATTVLDRLIEKTFETMSQEERLGFIERLFVEMSPENQVQLLSRLIRQTSGETAATPEPIPDFVQQAMAFVGPQAFGPWQMCYQMMVKINSAPHVASLDATDPARLFSALADETRIKIVKLLTEGALSVDSLTQALDAPQSTVSHHLRVLKEAGLVQAEKRGRSIFYSLDQAVEVG